MGEKQFIIAKHEDLLFVSNCDVKNKIDFAKNELLKIMNRFFKLYTMEQVKNWNGDNSIFVGFEKQITDSMDPAVERLKTALW
jgi:hypothetical protein